MAMFVCVIFGSLLAPGFLVQKYVPKFLLSVSGQISNSRVGLAARGLLADGLNFYGLPHILFHIVLDHMSKPKCCAGLRVEGASNQYHSPMNRIG